METFKTVQNLFDYVCSLFFRKTSFFTEIGLYISSLAKLCNNEHIFLRFEWINVFDDVFVLTGSENFDLSLNKFFEFGFWMNDFPGDGFDCNCLFGIWIKCFIDDGITSGPKLPNHGVTFKLFAYQAFFFLFLCLSDLHFIINFQKLFQFLIFCRKNLKLLIT